jgi:transposase-like protein
VIQSQAALIAIRADWEDRCQVLGAEPVVSDHHQGLKTAVRAVLPEAVWQRRGMRKQPTLPQSNGERPCS